MNRAQYRSQAGTARCSGHVADFPNDARVDFDSEVWMALIEEQRQLIAAAAGVDASKVNIRIGH